MNRATALAAGAAGVVAVALLVAAVVPGVVANPEEDAPARPGPVRLNDVSIARGPVGGETATLQVETRLEHRGPPADNVTVEFRAVDDDSGLLATTETVDVGTVRREGEVVVRANLSVRREGSYRIETYVYRDGSRIDEGRRTVAGLEALEPDYADTGVQFTRSEVLPAVSVSVVDAGSNASTGDGSARRVTLGVAASLTNRADEPAGDLRVELIARQADSNLVADRTAVEVSGIRPGRTDEADAELTVPDDYNYYVDAVLYRDGVVVDTARTVANLDPEERLDPNVTVRDRELDVSDFEGGGRAGQGATPTPAPTEAAGGGAPGFGPVVAVAALALLGAALLVRRWSA
jgi:hypothetical protein